MPEANTIEHIEQLAAKCADRCKLSLDQYYHVCGRLADDWAGLRPLPAKLEPLRDPPSIDYVTYRRLFAVW
jgi:hypothetical protein